MTLALIPGLPTVGPTELIILLTIILLVFGAKRIPELAKGIGSGVREFKKGTSGQYENDEVKDRKEDKELPRSEPSANVRAEDVNTRAAHAEQKR